jgi:hypothetical protein
MASATTVTSNSTRQFSIDVDVGSVVTLLIALTIMTVSWRIIAGNVTIIIIVGSTAIPVRVSDAQYHEVADWSRC